MHLRAIDHVQLAMPAGQEDAARAFYAGLLGLPETPKPAHLATRGGCWFESDTVKLHLGVEQDFRPAKKAHPALLVSDLPSLVGRLTAAGVEVVDDEPLDGFDRVYVYDPFGNRLELLESLEAQREREALDAMPYNTDPELAWVAPNRPDLPYEGEVPEDVKRLAASRRRQRPRA